MGFVRSAHARGVLIVLHVLCILDEIRFNNFHTTNWRLAALLASPMQRHSSPGRCHALGQQQPGTCTGKSWWEDLLLGGSVLSQAASCRNWAEVTLSRSTPGKQQLMIAINI